MSPTARIINVSLLAYAITCPMSHQKTNVTQPKKHKMQ